MTKRKSFRNRTQALLQVERDRWLEFVELCDRERKSVSLKIDELLTEELQKKAVGEPNPINISYGKEEEKPSQSDLRQWFAIVDTAESHQTLGMYKGQALEIARRADKRSMELRKNGIMR